MKKSELKSIIKECVKEVLFDEGVLSNLVAEVAFGIAKAQSQVLEQKSTNDVINQKMERENQEMLEEQKRKKLLETKRKVLDSIGSEKMKHVFDGTTPLPQPGSNSAHSPMSGVDPNDAGVDISGIFGLAGKKWQHLK